MDVRIDAIGVVVSDMAGAIAFYSRLGCVFGEGDEDEPHAECELGGGVRLMLDDEASLESMGLADDAGPHGGGRIALAVRCATPADVDALYESLDADGLGRRPPWDAPWGQRYAMASDPDGTHVDLYAPLPT